MVIKRIEEAPIKKGMRVIIRADFDVAVKSGRVWDDFRIRACVPTIRYVLKKGGRVRIIAHLGRPGARRNKKLSLRPAAIRLSKILRRRVILVANPFGPKANGLRHDSSDILLLENIRFWPGEEKNDAAFARRIASWGSIYVNEAFAASHRAHASVSALTKLLPSYAGLNIWREISFLTGVFERSRRPLTAVIGGAKTETKLPVLERFLRFGATVLVAGAPANTFFLAEGRKIGKSLADKELAPNLRRFLRHPRIVLPVDLLRSRNAIVDVGPRTVRLFFEKAQNAKKIIWNGPLGHTPAFSRGTVEFAKKLKRVRGLKIVGGGDTVTILKKHHLLNVFDHVSTGGGAMLEFLAGKKLPGIEALKQ